jgi:hypothetical protein
MGKKEQKTTLTVNSFKTNQPLSKNQFIFAKVNIQITTSIN